MAKVAGVKFRKVGKIYNFKSAAFILKENDHVIVETEHGLMFGKIAIVPKNIKKSTKKLKPIVRIATKEDFIKKEEIKIFEKKAHDFCIQRINDLKLIMNLFKVESTFDQHKLTFFYTADGRVDFRELIKLLVKKFNIKIELRQVGIRNLSRHCGGIGKCGRELCCCSFMNNFEQISIKMAKEQGLSLNPTKISGACGRLMCCLTFENKTYKSLKRSMPKLGKKITTKEGKGRVIKQNVLKDSVTIRIDENTFVEMPCGKADLLPHNKT